jgi:hypothetical protein
MRIQVFLFALLLLATSASCQRSSAGVAIPSQQTFLLGEYADYPYEAKLENKGSQMVTIELRSKSDQSVMSSVQLSPKQVESFQVSLDQIVAMVNSSNSEAQISAKMSKKVIGMNYVGQEEEVELSVATSEKVKTQNGITLTENAGPPRKKSKATISSGEAFVLGEGTSSNYSADLKVFGGPIKVSVRDRRSNEQTQGYGLANGSETINIRPYEILYLVHEGKIPARVSVDFSKPVSGARVVELE